MVFLTSSRGGQGGQIFLGVYLWVYYAVPENLFITPHYPYLKLRFFTRNHPTYFANIDTSDSLHPSHIQTRSYTYCCQSELHSYWLVVFRFGMAWFGLVTTWIDWVLLHQKTYPRGGWRSDRPRRLVILLIQWREISMCRGSRKRKFWDVLSSINCSQQT